MKRRDFLKQVAATAAVGAVAPQVLAEPVSFTTPWMSLEPIGYDLRRIESEALADIAGASRVVVGRTQYEIALDVADWTWKWMPVSGISVVREADKLFLKVVDTEVLSEA